MSELLRYKDLANYSVEEHFQRLQAEGRGEAFRVETDEYKRARAEALADAGFDEEADTATRSENKPREEWDVEDHMDYLRRNPR